jgi:hypothetical protein
MFCAGVLLITRYEVKKHSARLAMPDFTMVHLEFVKLHNIYILCLGFYSSLVNIYVFFASGPMAGLWNMTELPGWVTHPCFFRVLVKCGVFTSVWP